MFVGPGSAGADPTGWQGLTIYQKGELKGWHRLYNRLVFDGFSRVQLRELFEDIKMPYNSSLIFVKDSQPIVDSKNYGKLMPSTNLRLARSFLKQHKKLLGSIEEEYGVEKEILVAIVLVESNLGRDFGKQPSFVTLARLSNLAEDGNLRYNLKVARKFDSSARLSGLRQLGRSYEAKYYPELKALLVLASRLDMKPLDIKGPRNHYLGIAKLAPSFIAQHGLDGDMDGKISPYSIPDSLKTLASFLNQAGWQEEVAKEDNQQVLLEYRDDPKFPKLIFKIAGLISKN